MNLENNEKLETYRKTSTIVYNLQQDIIKSMEFFLYSHVKDDHCFMITIKESRWKHFFQRPTRTVIVFDLLR